MILSLAYHCVGEVRLQDISDREWPPRALVGAIAAQSSVNRYRTWIANNFAKYLPVRLITVEAEDGSISELWFGDGEREDIPVSC